MHRLSYARNPAWSCTVRSHRIMSILTGRWNEVCCNGTISVPKTGCPRALCGIDRQWSSYGKFRRRACHDAHALFLDLLESPASSDILDRRDTRSWDRDWNWVMPTQISSAGAIASTQYRNALHTTSGPICRFLVAELGFTCYRIFLKTYRLRLDTLARYLGLWLAKYLSPFIVIFH